MPLKDKRREKNKAAAKPNIGSDSKIAALIQKSGWKQQKAKKLKKAPLASVRRKTASVFVLSPFEDLVTSPCQSVSCPSPSVEPGKPTTVAQEYDFFA